MADGLFGSGPFGQFMGDPMTQLALGLMSAPRTDPQGRRLGFGQQVGSAFGNVANWQQMMAQMQIQQFQQQEAQRRAQMLERETALRQKMREGAFNTPEGKLDYEKLFQQGITEGVMPFEAGMKLQESKENREERLAANREMNIQRAELAREQMAQRGEIARSQIDLRRDLAGMTNAIAQQQANTQRMMVEGRIADMKQRQAISPFASAPTYKSGVRVLEEQYKLLPEYDKLEAQLNRWAELNERVETGPIAGRLPTAALNSEFQDLKKLENYLAMNNFKPSGAMSNLERGYIVGGGPNTTSYKEANLNNAKLMLGAVQNAREFLDFQQAWLDKYGKLPPTSMWQKYLNDNPHYILNEENRMLVPNPKRRDWATYFGSAAPQQTAPRLPAGWAVKER